jgi:hypothetical protein
LDLRVLGGVKFLLCDVLNGFSILIFDGRIGTIAEKELKHFEISVVSGIVNRVIAFFAELINVKL